MRLTVYLMLLFFCNQFGWSQNNVWQEKHSYDFRNHSLSEILDHLNRQSGYHFSYSSNTLPLNQPITFKATDIVLADALTGILTPIHIHWQVIGSQIALKMAEGVPFRICGQLRDRATQIPIPYAYIVIKGTSIGVQSSYSGKFCLEHTGGRNVVLLAKAFGYKTEERNVSVQDTALFTEWFLEQRNIELNETIITSDKIIETTSTSAMQLKAAQVESSKGVSNDIMKSLLSAPGVLAISDFFGPANINVRGGEGYENAFLLDNIRLPWPFYFLGQSVINADMIEKAELLTGGYQSVYGNAMSSVLNFSTRNGNMEKYSVWGDLNFFNSALTVEGPLIKNRLSGIVGYRQSNINFLLRPLGLETDMYDFTSKMVWKPAEKHQINYTALYVTDRLRINIKDNPLDGLKSVNYINAHNLSWQSILSGKSYNKLSLLYSDINLSAGFKTASFRIKSAAYTIRNDFSWYPGTGRKFKTGIEWNVVPENIRISDVYKSIDIKQKDSLRLQQLRQTDTLNQQGALYVHFEDRLGQRITYSAGARLDYNQFNRSSDFSPRLAAMYKAFSQTYLSVAWGYYYQVPETYGIIRNPLLKSSRSEHFIFSVRQLLPKGMSAKAEVYYKNYTRLVVFDTAFRYTNNGKGNARGLELSIQKETGRLNGWLAYAYSIAERQRNLQENVYTAFYDQPHALNVQVAYSLKKRKRYWMVPVLFSIQFKYATGTPYTPVTGTDSVAGRLQLLTGPINSMRNADYQNFNAKVEWQRYFGRSKQHTTRFYIDFWNLLGSRNLTERIYRFSGNGGYTVQNNFTTPFLFSVGVKLIFNDLRRLEEKN